MILSPKQLLWILGNKQYYKCFGLLNGKGKDEKTFENDFFRKSNFSACLFIRWESTIECIGLCGTIELVLGGSREILLFVSVV